MRYAYPCEVIGNEDDGEGFSLHFPDVYGANAGGWTREEALEIAEECLAVALGGYVKFHEDIPHASPLVEGQVLVPVPLLVAAKLSIYTAMRQQGINNVALAARLGIHESAVRRIVDPMYRSHISQVEKALRALGRSLVVEDTETVRCSKATILTSV